MKKALLICWIYFLVALLGYFGQIAFLSYLDDGTSLIAYLHEHKIKIWLASKIISFGFLLLLFNSQYRHNFYSLWKNTRVLALHKYAVATLMCSALALWAYFDYLPTGSIGFNIFRDGKVLIYSALVWFVDWCLVVAYLHEFPLDDAVVQLGLPGKYLAFISGCGILFLLNFILMNPKEIEWGQLLFAHFLIYGVLFWESNLVLSLIILIFFSIFVESVYPWNLYMMNDKIIFTAMPVGHSLYWLTFIFLPVSGYIFLRRRNWL